MSGSQANVLNNISLNTKQNLRSVPKTSSKERDVKQKSFKIISTETLVRTQETGNKNEDTKVKEFEVRDQDDSKIDDCSNSVQKKKGMKGFQKRCV